MKSSNQTAVSAAALFVAGALGIAAPTAKGDIDFSISLNLGWSDFDPCVPVVPVCDPWYGSWSDPCPPRWHWRGCGTSSWGGWYGGNVWYPPPSYGPACYPYRPAYRWSSGVSSGWWWGGGSNSWWYITTSPGYCGPYGVTTYYSPYYDYYRPVNHWGVSITWYDNDCDGRWYGHSGYRRGYRHGYRDGYRDGFGDGGVTVVNNTTIINNPEPVAQNGRGVRQQPLSRGGAAHTVEPVPAQAFGVNGPPADGSVAPGGKGPRRVSEPAVAPVAVKPIEGKPVIAPVAVKPIESKPVVSKPGRGDGRVTVSKPSLPTMAPTVKPAPVVDAKPTAPVAAPAVKPVETVSKPAPTVSKPNWEQPRVSKPAAPMAAPVSAPTPKPTAAPSRSSGFTKPAERPEPKPTAAPTARPTTRTVTAPSFAPKPAAAPAPSAKPVAAPRPAAAPSRVAAPAPRPSAAPAPRPAAPAAPAAKPVAPSGVNKRG